MNSLPSCMSVCYMHVLSSYGGQKRAPDSLEQELQIAWSHLVSAENESQVL